MASSNDETSHSVPPNVAQSMAQHPNVTPGEDFTAYP